MSTLLCASCGHSFPDIMLENASFSERVGRCLSTTSQLVRETQGKTSEDSHRLVQLGQLLQQLCGMMEEEVQLLQGRPKDPRGAGGTRSAAGAAATTSKRNGADVLTLTQTSRRDGTGYMNGTSGNTTRQQMQMMTTMDRTAGGTATLKMFDGAVPAYQLKRMVSAFDLVSATLYTILEGLAVQCRAGVALLWLRPRQNASSDLVAPFVVGRELTSLAHSAPYSTPESSVPCVVCQTGVALNLLPQPHQTSATSRTAAAAAADLSLTELMEQTNAAQLLVPVHDRYTERNDLANTLSASAAATAAGAGGTTATATSRSSVAAGPASAAAAVVVPSVIAVVHLIGSPVHPVPFHRHNEEAAAQTAVLLSHILSSYYDAMMSDWANRFYIPTTLHATAKYTAGLDMRPDAKAMDDFTAPPLLMYRATVSDPREPQSANEARDALKLLQQSAVRKAAPLRPMANVRDLCQHATNMETNWIAAVQQTARLEKEIGTLAEDLLRRDVGAMQRGHDGRPAGRRSLASSVSAAHPLPPGARHRSMPSTGKDKTAASASAAVTTNASAPDGFTSMTSVDIPVELSPAVAYSLEGAAASAAAGNPVLPLSGDVLKPEEMQILEAVTLRRLKSLGADTTIFEGTS